MADGEKARNARAKTYERPFQVSTAGGPQKRMRTPFAESAKDGALSAKNTDGLRVITRKST